MKVKNEKGITIVTLVIMIVLMLMLVTVSIKVGTNAISETKLQTIRTNLLLIQTKVKTISEKNNFDSEANPLVGTKVTEQGQETILEKLKTILGEQETSYEDYYSLSKENLESMKLDKIEIDDGYVVNYNTEEVIYIKGIEDSKGIVKYKLSEIEE